MANIVPTNTSKYAAMLTVLFFKTLVVILYWALTCRMNWELDLNMTFPKDSWNYIQGYIPLNVKSNWFAKRQFKTVDKLFVIPQISYKFPQVWIFKLGVHLPVYQGVVEKIYIQKEDIWYHFCHLIL